MNNLQEKIELLKAYKEGKTVERYDDTSNTWCKVIHDIWDFEYCQYRIKPIGTLKFKVHDNLVYRGDENKPFPAIYTVKDIDNTGYTLDGDEFEKSPSVIEKEYINERDVLWYFEWRTAKDQFIKDFEPYRITIEEAIDKVITTKDLIECFPIRALGFRIKKEDTNDLKRED